MTLIATALQAVRHKKPGSQRLDQHEHRRASFGFLNAFQRDTPFLLKPELITRAKMADTHVQTAVVTNKGAVTVNNVRSCTIADKENTSAIYTFVWATVASDFTMLPMQYYNNEIDYASDLAQKVEELDEAFALVFEEGCFDAAEAAKTVEAAYNAQTPYDVTGDFMSVPLDQRYDFYNQLKSIMNVHNFRGNVNIVGSAFEEANVRRYLADSSLKVIGDAVANSSEMWQFANYNFTFSTQMPQEAGYSSRLFASAPGSYAIMNWNPKVFQTNSVTSNGTKFSETPIMPLSGMSFGHQYRSECLDGDKVKEFHQMSTDICYVTAYNSDPADVASSIFEARMVAPETPSV